MLNLLHDPVVKITEWPERLHCVTVSVHFVMDVVDEGGAINEVKQFSEDLMKAGKGMLRKV